MLKYVDSSDFEKEVLNHEGKVLVDFYADWCGPCRALGPILENVSKQEGSIDIVKLNVDENQDLAAKYNVMTIPTMMIFEKGEVKNTTMGLMGEKQILEFMKK